MTDPPKLPSPNKDCLGAWLTAAAIFAVAAAITLLSEFRSFNLYDEGVIVTGAARVMSGQIPHRDFYANYGPGQFYVLAALFKLFGQSILVARLWGSFAKAGIVVAVYVLGKRVMPAPWSFVSSIFSLLWLCLADNPVWPAWPALLAALCSAWSLFNAFEKGPSVRTFLTAGVLTGVAALFRYDIGFIVCAAEATVLLAYGAIDHPFPGRTRLASVAAPVGAYSVGIGLVCLPIALTFLISGTAGDFIFDIVFFPSHHYASTRGLPFPMPLPGRRPYSTTEYIVYFPLIMVLGALLAIIPARGPQKSPAPRFVSGLRDSPRALWQLALLAALTLGFFGKGFVRVSSLHMSLAVIPAILILAALLSANARKKVPAAFAAFLAVAMIAGVIPSLKAYEAVGARLSGNFNHITRRDRLSSQPDSRIDDSDSCTPRVGFERIACFRLGLDQQAAVQFIQLNTNSSDTIFVGLPQHSRIFVNNVGFYFVAGRVPATKWYHFDPGLQTSDAIQQLMIGDLAKSRPKYVVLDSEWEGVREPNESATDSGVKALDAFIQSNYIRVAIFGELTIFGEARGHGADVKPEKSALAANSRP